MGRQLALARRVVFWATWGGDRPGPQHRDEIVGVIILVPHPGRPARARQGVHQVDGCLPFRHTCPPPTRPCRFSISNMAQETQLGLPPCGLPVQPRLGIRRRGMRRIRTTFAAKSRLGLPGSSSGTVGCATLLEAFVSGPGFDQRPIDRDMLVGQEAVGRGLRQDLLEEGRRDPPASSRSRF